MNQDHARATLSQAVNRLDHLAATLATIEHGIFRDTIGRARETLKTTSAELLVLRARLRPARPPKRTEAPSA